MWKAIFYKFRANKEDRIGNKSKKIGKKIRLTASFSGICEKYFCHILPRINFPSLQYKTKLVHMKKGSIFWIFLFPGFCAYAQNTPTRAAGARQRHHGQRQLQIFEQHPR